MDVNHFLKNKMSYEATTTEAKMTSHFGPKYRGMTTMSTLQSNTYYPSRLDENKSSIDD